MQHPLLALPQQNAEAADMSFDVYRVTERHLYMTTKGLTIEMPWQHGELAMPLQAAGAAWVSPNINLISPEDAT